MKDIKTWELLYSEELFSASPWVRLRKDKIKLPNGRIVDDYYTIELPEYVMVYAKRDKGEALFMRQYKHALGSITLTLPTGCLEDGELPLECAKREFLEETGYIADKWRSVGSFLIDGNKGCGKVHFFIAEELKKIAEPVADDMEESEILFMPVNSVMEAIYKGEINILATASLIAIAANQDAGK